MSLTTEGGGKPCDHERHERHENKNLNRGRRPPINFMSLVTPNFSSLENTLVISNLLPRGSGFTVATGEVAPAVISTERSDEKSLACALQAGLCFAAGNIYCLYRDQRFATQLMDLSGQSASEAENALKPKVYIETSIISYLTASISNDLRVAANQNTTIEWWETRRPGFEIFISEFVVV